MYRVPPQKQQVLHIQFPTTNSKALRWTVDLIYENRKKKEKKRKRQACTHSHVSTMHSPLYALDQYTV